MCVIYVCTAFHKNNYILLFCTTDKSSQDSVGEREHAAALYMACRHLPSPLLSFPGERVCMLSEAVKALEMVGDQKRLDQCYQLMKSISTNSAAN